LPIVRTVDLQLANDLTINKEYLPILGLAKFSKEAVKLVIGNDSPAIVNNLVYIYIVHYLQLDNQFYLLRIL
jgi:aspartate/tyrosine/aromatic aminotransferase